VIDFGTVEIGDIVSPQRFTVELAPDTQGTITTDLDCITIEPAIFTKGQTEITVRLLNEKLQRGQQLQGRITAAITKPVNEQRNVPVFVKVRRYTDDDFAHLFDRQEKLETLLETRFLRENGFIRKLETAIAEQEQRFVKQLQILEKKILDYADTTKKQFAEMQRESKAPAERESKAPAERQIEQIPLETRREPRTPTRQVPRIPTPEKLPAGLVFRDGKIISEKDGAEMILIPEGEFLMGTSDEQIKELLRQFSDWKREWFADEQPQHRVYLDEFYIDKYPVTNAQFEQFVKATRYKTESDWRKYYKKGKEKHPVVYVSWNDASAYCKWAGKRLPTEAEWEKAARGADGRIWPWGNVWDKNKCNSKDGGPGTTTPVGSYPAGASPYGVMDMAGNVWEWCADRYDKDYYAHSPQHNPQGSSSRTWCVLRGGGWFNNTDILRCADRDNLVPWHALCNVGFRCSQDL
jgi:formylglycine-generating enzyme required for sulfatase activity